METLASPAAISGGSGRVSPLEISPIRRVDIVGSQERSLDGGIARLSAGKIRLENSLLLGKRELDLYSFGNLCPKKDTVFDFSKWRRREGRRSCGANTEAGTKGD